MEFDAKTGRILCVGGVDEEMHKFILSALNHLNGTRHKTLTMILSTGGGDSFIAMGIYDLLASNTKPICIIANGPCNSAGTLLLQAGHTRLATPHSSFLYHYGQPDADNWQEQEFQKRMDDKWIDLIAERTNKTSRRELDLMHKGETYLTANDALLHGLIDGIINSVM